MKFINPTWVIFLTAWLTAVHFFVLTGALQVEKMQGEIAELKEMIKKE